MLHLDDHWPDVWLSFGQPAWLLVWPVCAAVVASVAWRRHRLTALDWSTWTVVRLVVLAALVLALADPSIEWRRRDLAVVLVRDVSASVPEARQGDVDGFLHRGEAERRDDDLFGEVATAAGPVIRRMPAKGWGAGWGTAGDLPADRSATDLASAVLLASRLVGPTAGIRVVLASDGNETKGDLLAASRELRSRSIPVDVVPLAADRDPWLAIDRFTLPAHARQGTTATAQLRLLASRPMTARITVRNGDGTQSATTVDLAAGVNPVRLLLPVGQRSIERFDVSVEPDEASAESSIDPRALSASALVPTEGPSNILVLANDPSRAEAMAEALKETDVTATARSLDASPTTVDGWAAYDAVVLADASALDLTPVAQASLKRYVEDLAGGLVVTGGPDGFARDWLDQPIAELLPVDLRLPESRTPQPAAIAIVIDRSGSMSQLVQQSGRSQQQFANDAAVDALRALTRYDFVTVIAFDSSPDTVVPLQRADHPEAIAARVRAIAPAGGTQVFAALEAALTELARVPRAAKHIIVLTDGNSAGDTEAGIRRAAAFREAGITISTIAIGDDADATMLERLALAGGGRHHRIGLGGLARTLPLTIRREIESIRRAPIEECSPFTPLVTAHEGPIDGSLPLPAALTGYGVVADRDDRSVVALRSPKSDPILAFWNRGLGRVVAFTGDPFGKWANGWSTQAAFGPFWRRMGRWVQRPLGDQRAVLAVDDADGETRFSLTLRDSDGTALAVSRATARFTGADGGSVDVPLEADGLGVYRGTLPSGTEPVGLVTARFVAASNGSTIDGVARAAVNRRPPIEWRSLHANPRLLESVASATSGRVLPLETPAPAVWSREGVRFPTWSKAIWQLCALVAAGLFVLDVAARRLWVPLERRRQDLQQPAPSAAPPTAPAESNADASQLARLREAKRRAVR